MAPTGTRSLKRLGMDPRKKLLIAGGVAVICGALAIPYVFSGDAEQENTSAPVAAPVAPQPAPSGPERHVTDTQDATPEPPAAPTPRIAASAEGDIELALSLRWREFETGERVQAGAKFINRSLRTVYLPASGEPNAGLAIVIEDADGAEVRRIVEAGKAGQLPRRLERLDSADDVTIALTLVAEEDAPLAPGKYSAHAEFQPDPRLARLGVALWTAPKGPIRSATVEFVVRAAAGK